MKKFAENPIAGQTGANAIGAGELHMRLARCCDPGIGFSAGPICQTHSSPFPAEHQAVASAAETRRIDFFNGRHHARLALEAVGCSARPIPRLPDRQPMWPSGFIGSISHSKSTCVALAAARAHVAAIGVDVEGISPRLNTVRSKTLHPLERTVRPESDAAYNTAVFSAKEAFFKAYFPMTEHFLGFQDAVVRFHEGTERFDISIVNPAVPALFGRRQFDGMTLICKGEVVSVLWIATNDGPQRVPKPGRPDSVNGQTDLPSEPI